MSDGAGGASVDARSRSRAALRARSGGPQAEQEPRARRRCRSCAATRPSDEAAVEFGRRAGADVPPARREAARQGPRRGRREGRQRQGPAARGGRGPHDSDRRGALSRARTRCRTSCCARGSAPGPGTSGAGAASRWTTRRSRPTPHRCSRRCGTAGFADATVGEPRIVPERGRRRRRVSRSRRAPGASSRRVTVAGVPADVKTPELPLAKGGPWSQRAEEQAAAPSRPRSRKRATPTPRHRLARVQAGTCVVKLLAEPGSAVGDRPGRRRGPGANEPSGGRAGGRHPGGEVAGPQAQLAAQRRLLALGIFQRVNIHPIPDQDDRGRRGLVIDLKEGPTGRLRLRPRLRHRAEDAASRSRGPSSTSSAPAAASPFDSRFSHLEKRFQLTYREPAAPRPAGVPDLRSRSIARRSTSPPTTSSSAGCGSSSATSRSGRGGRCCASTTRSSTERGARRSSPSSSGASSNLQDRVAHAEPHVGHARRHLLAPPRCLRSRSRGSSAFKVFQARRGVRQADRRRSRRTTPARAASSRARCAAGAIEPRGRVPGSPTTCRCPINVRFFAGGRVTNRAFPIDLLGIPNETLRLQPTPPDGSATGLQASWRSAAPGMLITNLEWRFPIYGAVGGDVFVDGGNVWPAWRDVRRGGDALGRRHRPAGRHPGRAAPPRVRLEVQADDVTASDGTLVRESPGELFFSFGNAVLEAVDS